MHATQGKETRQTVADEGKKICGACGSENATEAENCGSCGARIPQDSYEASVEAGLRRLESEKLKFLSPGSVLSKFDPETVAAFEPKNAQQDGETETDLAQAGASSDGAGDFSVDSFVTRDDLLRDMVLSDDFDADRTTAYERVDGPPPASAPRRAADRISECAGVTDSEIRAAVLDDAPAAGPKQPFYATLNFAAIRHFSDEDRRIPTETGMMPIGGSDRCSQVGGEMHSDGFEAEKMHSDFRDDSMRDADNREDSVPDMPPPCPFRPSDDPSVQVLSCSDVQIADDGDADETREACFDAYASTIDSGATAERVRAALNAQKANREAAQFRSAANESAQSSDVARSKILKPATGNAQNGGKSEDGCADSSVTAIEKLKKIGIFEPVRHSEVNRSIDAAHRQNEEDIVDALIPPSKVEMADADPSDIHTLTERVVPARSLLLAAAKNAKTDADDDGDGEDKTYNQSPEAVDEIKYAAMLASAAKDPPKHAADGRPQVVPVGQAYNLDLDNRETLPIDVAPSLEQLKNAQKHVARKPSRIEAPVSVQTEEKGESAFVRTMWAALIVILLGLIGVLLYLMGILSFISPSLAPRIETPNAKIRSEAAEPTPLAVRQAIARASFEMQMAVDPDIWLDSQIDEKVASLDERSRRPILEMAIDVHPSEWFHWRQIIADSLALSDYAGARDALHRAYRTAELDAGGLAEWKTLFNRSFAEDAHFIQPAQWATESDYDEIAPLGGGSTLSFKFRKDGTNVGAFKPHQTRLQSNYRSEIAAWRLCELLDCSFEIPHSRAVKIEKPVFYALYNRSKSAKKESYRAELKDIIWQASEEKTAVFGVLKDWVAKFTRFPIEQTSMWKPWLSQTDFSETYPPLNEALKPLRAPEHTKKLYNDILAMSRDLDTKGLASQISEVLTFDYLTGNWDRFSGVKSWWGVNCQFANGKIVSIDNGASFPAYGNEKVLERFMMTERFSARFIARLRMLDKDETMNLLFPEASEREKQSFEQFWTQRAAVLKRIDTLSEEYGVERVLSFD